MLSVDCIVTRLSKLSRVLGHEAFAGVLSHDVIFESHNRVVLFVREEVPMK